MKLLIDVGDPNAPQGSGPWCRSFHLTLCRLKHEGEFAVSNLKYSLRDFRDHEYFKTLADETGQPFKKWEAFVQAREPFGLGMPIDVAKAIIEERNDKKLLKEVMGPKGGDRGTARDGKGRFVKSSHEPQPDNVRLRQYGNSREDTLARLRRDRPDLAERVEAGEMSANAAAIEADIRKKPRRCCPNCGHEW